MAPRVRVLVLRAAGTNCDIETAHAFGRAGARAEIVHINQLLAHPEDLCKSDILSIPGGFSYGDDIAGGKVLAVELRFGLAEEIQSFIRRGGLVLGICNGFQVLVKLGLLPDGPDGGLRQQVTLTTNDSDHYEDRWVHLQVTSSRCPLLEVGEKLLLPVAHAEGKLVAADESTRRRLHEDGHVALRYLDDRGAAAPPYPFNPNGSVDGIAGLTDPTGRVLGLMPHPERHIFGYHRPDWTRGHAGGEGDGARIFRRAVATARSHH